MKTRTDKQRDRRKSALARRKANLVSFELADNEEAVRDSCRNFTTFKAKATIAKSDIANLEAKLS
jgi:hypothetical protein